MQHIRQHHTPQHTGCRRRWRHRRSSAVPLGGGRHRHRGLLSGVEAPREPRPARRRPFHHDPRRPHYRTDSRWAATARPSTRRRQKSRRPSVRRCGVGTRRWTCRNPGGLSRGVANTRISLRHSAIGYALATGAGRWVSAAWPWLWRGQVKSPFARNRRRERSERDSSTSKRCSVGCRDGHGPELDQGNKSRLGRVRSRAHHRGGRDGGATRGLVSPFAAPEAETSLKATDQNRIRGQGLLAITVGDGKRLTCVVSVRVQ